MEDPVDPTQPPSAPAAPTAPTPQPRAHNRFPGIPRNGVRNYYTVRFDPGFDADAAETNHIRSVAFGGGIGWLVDNFRTRDGFLHWPAQQDFPHDVSYETADGSRATIPARDLHLWHVAGRAGTGRGMACVALMAAPPAPEGFPDGPEWMQRSERLLLWPEGSLAGTPAMRAVEGALLGYLRGLREARAPGRREVLAETTDGCMAVVFMGRDKAVYYYDAEKGLVEPEGELEFAPSRTGSKEQQAEIYEIARDKQRALAGIIELEEMRAQIRGAGDELAGGTNDGK
ncbi:hypothetical protein C8A05DRAFT_36819 [Staphylotrichum tortipilum]|uniref:Uncharacterized protein n=1 Tax=Staphylotrichum tortipilum TaxID=2831512 RepID=A0AAN6MEW2_9PEZI|nr:hypothetical protein C8A05DRAFT_36819 [Staphylotrichum longicolle]